MRRTQSLLLAIFALALTASIAPADDALPPTRQLIKDTLALCNDPEKEYGSIYSRLAEAYIYVGDLPAARAILGEYRNDFWNQAGYQNCAVLEIELTGDSTIVPDALLKDDPEFTNWRLAIAYAKRGDSAKSLQHVICLPIGIATPLQLFGRQLLEPLLASGDRDAARQVLLRWCDTFANAKSISTYHRLERAIEHDIKLLVEFGEAERGKLLCQRWQEGVERETDIDEWGAFIGMSWARLGAAWAAAGDREKAKSAFRQAREWLDTARSRRLDPTREGHFLDYASAYTVLAARQRLVLGPEAARDVYEQAYHLANQATSSIFKDYGFVQIIKEQLKAGDLGGIPETLKRMVVLRHRADAWRIVSEHYLKEGDKSGALTVARAAAAELDRDNLETSVARDTANIAGCLARAGDVEFARQLFRRAISLSERHEDPKFDHQWIAGQQVGAGLLAEAYATIQTIPEPQTRLIPLAELARAAAKKEAMTKLREQEPGANSPPANRR